MKLNEITPEIFNADAATLLKWAVQTFPSKAVFASSFSAEDMVILHLIAALKLPIPIVTLDTGRLPEETYELIDTVRRCYPSIKIKTFFPERQEVEQLVAQKGFFSFRKSIENRKECCRIRKIEPLKKALQGAEAWLTGIRKEQSVTRTIAQKIEYDNNFGILKLNPLLDWSEPEVWDYLKKNNVPYNKLHDQGYPSIGCAPCTRAIQPGEDIRAGRWWWENPEQKECGLHGYCRHVTEEKKKI